MSETTRFDSTSTLAESFVEEAHRLGRRMAKVLNIRFGTDLEVRPVKWKNITSDTFRAAFALSQHRGRLASFLFGPWQNVTTVHIVSEPINRKRNEGYKAEWTATCGPPNILGFIPGFVPHTILPEELVPRTDKPGTIPPVIATQLMRLAATSDCWTDGFGPRLPKTRRKVSVTGLMTRS